MATPAQIAANRRNARMSTGPKTGQGKRASSRNAIRHGIYAEIPEAELRPIVEAIEAELGVLSPRETAGTATGQAARLAIAEVRLARALREEVAMLEMGDGEMRLEREFDLLWELLLEDKYHIRTLTNADHRKIHSLIDRIVVTGARYAAKTYHRTRKNLAAAEAAQQRALRDFLS